ncbi:hypothetical protein ACFPAF_16940 [Hymenobacter endophyticus]|uniref:DUF4138 domain-containing protein n=1 Tax=Hymenobacter endophyticus TaxID=3076335 RepID=A0ABU3TL31_9BACT|nr:hypothetical protein [Hymenobacter endophyticus]MDU0372091.1 hypothetical protein [Hymenobacter endophyticus]
MKRPHSYQLVLTLSLSLLCSAGSYAQRLKRVPVTPPPASLPAYAPASMDRASTPAPITPGPAPAHAGGYTDTGLHYTIERLAPPPPPPPPGSQPMLLDVAVSDSSTTYMVFAGPVSLVDVGMMDNYLLKIEANAVFVRARKKSAPPTPIMVRYGSKYWMGRLVTVKRPVMALYDLTKPNQLPPVPNGAAAAAAAYYNTAAAPASQSSVHSSATVAGGGMSPDGSANPDGNLADVDAPTTSTGAVMPTSSTGVAPDNPLALDREAHRKAFVNAKLRRLDNQRVEHPGVAVYENRVAVSLANVRNDKEFTYLRLRVDNTSSIDYHIDFVDFQLVENTKRRFLGKKRNESRRPLTPSGGRANQVIAGGTTGYLYYAVPLYAATDLGYLHVELHELNGARTLLLPIPAKVINTAPTL